MEIQTGYHYNEHYFLTLNTLKSESPVLLFITEIMNLNTIIERTVALREEGHAFNPNQVRGIMTQIEWTVGVDAPERANDGIDAIIELATRLREEGRVIEDNHARVIMQQIEWGAGLIPRRATQQPEEEMPATVVCEIDKSQFHELCAEACAICLETHTKGDSVLTECNHEFCHQCWNQWITRAKTCPACRKSCPSTTSFTTK